ncbi:MAG: ATP-binding cassette domain-containing protein, partial [Solirubrobacterales bacterium]
SAPDPSRGTIVFDAVSFAYPGRAPVLQGLDLKLEPGETVAVTGPSGGGKTTLVSLLLRLADPDTGTVSCDGVDLTAANPTDWRRQIAWVPQRPTIFAGSIADNLRLYRTDATETEISDVVVRADLQDLVAELPDGLRTQVGEGGRRLSLGQSQRLALGRAMLSGASLIVLDEPTAHLDRSTEILLSRAMDELTRETTALIVSHRDQPITSADRVLELAAGQLHETPTTVGWK